VIPALVIPARLTRFRRVEYNSIHWSAAACCQYLPRNQLGRSSTVEWFQGKTLTGCANDLHGPYLGPDGRIYWCNGAFARQTYERPGKTPLVPRTTHIFHCRPDGSGIEPVLTGRMDKPVDVAFTPGRRSRQPGQGPTSWLKSRSRRASRTATR